jgi:hypothetical protein
MSRVNQRQLDDMEYSTVAALKAVTTVREGIISFCLENNTNYRYIAAGSAYTANDTSVLITGNGGNTRWVGIAGKYIYFDPASSGMTDTNINAAIISTFTNANDGKSAIRTAIGTTEVPAEATFTDEAGYITADKATSQANIITKGGTSAGGRTLAQVAADVLTIPAGGELNNIMEMTATAQGNIANNDVLYGTRYSRSNQQYLSYGYGGIYRVSHCIFNGDLWMATPNMVSAPSSNNSVLLYIWNTAYERWDAQVAPANTKPLYDAELKVFNGELYLAVGSDTSTYIFTYKYDSANKVWNALATPTTAPANTVNCCSMEVFNNELYLALGTSTSAQYSFLYKLNTIDNTWTKLNNLATPPTGNVTDIKLYVDSNILYLAISHAVSPYVSTYTWNTGTLVFDKIVNPVTLPTGDGQGCDLCTYNSVLYLAVFHFTSPYITTYTLSGGVWVKIANPATLPPGSSFRGSLCVYNSELYMAVGHASSAPYLKTYKLNNGTGFWDVLTAPTYFLNAQHYVCDLMVGGTKLLLVGGSNTGSPASGYSTGSYVSVSWYNTGTSTWDLGILPNGVMLDSQDYEKFDTALHDSKYYFAATSQYGKKVTVFDYNSVAGTFMPIKIFYDATWNKLGVALRSFNGYLYLAYPISASPYLATYRYDSSAGTWTQLANPVTLPTGTPGNVKLELFDGKLFLMVAHATTPYFTSYYLNTADDTWVKIANPSSLVNSQGHRLDTVVFNNQLWVILNYDAGTYTKMYRMNAGTTIWDAVANIPSMGNLGGISLKVYNNELYFAHSYSSASPYSYVKKYPGSDTAWIDIPAGNVANDGFGYSGTSLYLVVFQNQLLLVQIYSGTTVISILRGTKFIATVINISSLANMSSTYGVALFGGIIDNKFFLIGYNTNIIYLHDLKVMSSIDYTNTAYTTFYRKSCTAYAKAVATVGQTLTIKIGRE